MERKVEITSDGSRTLYVPALDEHYHSVKGAVAESLHVFIRMGLEHHPSVSLEVLEVGFGTGLNAFLTCLAAGKLRKQVHYTSVELYPLQPACVASLGYPERIAPGHAEDFRRLHACPWEEDVCISPFFTLHKREADFTACVLPPSAFDVVYFDAFAPEKQPEMWTHEVFARLWEAMRPGGILATYCAKGVVRRMLLQAGFSVERLPGPPGGKREILRAVKS